jgi:hypothetical protein
MKWIILLWTSFVSVLIAIYAYAWRDMLKTKRVVRPYIDDIPFRLNRIVRATDLKRTSRVRADGRRARAAQLQDEITRLTALGPLPFLSGST